MFIHTHKVIEFSVVQVALSSTKMLLLSTNQENFRSKLLLWKTTVDDSLLYSMTMNTEEKVSRGKKKISFSSTG